MSLLLVLLGLVAVGLAVLLSVCLLRALWRTDDARGVLTATYWLAAGVATLSVIAALSSAATTLFARVVEVDVPVETFWPGVPTGASLTGLGATIESGGFRTASLRLSGLSTVARLSLASSTVLTYAAGIAILMVIAIACRQARAGTPFSPVVPRTAMVAAVVVGTCGLLGQVLAGVGANLAATEALDYEGYGPDCRGGCADISTWWPTWTPTFQLEFWPIGAALALAALAIVWRHGTRLQHDTEGLV